MTGIIVSFFGFLESLVGKFPDLSVNNEALSSMASGMDSVFEFIGKANFLVPIDHILLVIALVYGIRAAKLLVFAINWVIRRIADVIP